jgi:hypothetical protein
MICLSDTGTDKEVMTSKTRSRIDDMQRSWERFEFGILKREDTRAKERYPPLCIVYSTEDVHESHRMNSAHGLWYGAQPGPRTQS